MLGSHDYHVWISNTAQTHPPTHSATHSLTHPLAPSLSHSLTHSIANLSYRLSCDFIVLCRELHHDGWEAHGDRLFKKCFGKVAQQAYTENNLWMTLARAWPAMPYLDKGPS